MNIVITLGSDFVLTSFDPQFDFYDVIYHVRPCNIDISWHNVIYTTH